jgi:hypothetical protein
MRRITGLAMAAVLTLTMVACGSDDDTSSENTATTTAAEETTTTADGDDVGDGGVADEGLAGLIDEDCQFLLAGVYLNPLAGLAPGTDADVAVNSSKLEAIADEAPEEIQDAMDTISEGYAELAEAFRDVDLTDVQSFADPEVQSAIEDLQAVFDEDYQEAAETVSDYISENCGD